MKITIETCAGKKITLGKIKSAVLTKTAGVPCDSLSIEFAVQSNIGEINRIFAEYNGKTVFSGYCDCQKTSAAKSGFSIYIYARSSACLLVDSLALPYTYNRPTARQLFITYAKSLGFDYDLPEIKCNGKYEVSSGTSRFAAINNLVSMVSGSNIRIDADNKVHLLEVKNKISEIKGKIISAEEMINRSEPISQIHYKRDLSGEYECHAVSQFAAEMGIDRQKYVNLTSLAVWQRENKISKMLSDSFDSYKILKLTVDGFFDGELYERFCYAGAIGSFDDYLLTETVHTFDAYGIETRLTLKKNIDKKEVNYVDK